MHLQAILKRLEAKMSVKEGAADVSPLMARLFPKTAKAGGQLERYPARVFLCAYMVQHHPQVVFNTQGELEGMLAAAGKTMLGAFEALLEQLAEPMQVTARSVQTCVPCLIQSVPCILAVLSLQEAVTLCQCKIPDADSV